MVVSVVIGLSVNIHDTGGEGLKNEKVPPQDLNLEGVGICMNKFIQFQTSNVCNQSVS
jgi:hypothetical protein